MMKVKTTNLGSLNRLTYDIVLKEAKSTSLPTTARSNRAQPIQLTLTVPVN